ncbi:hypothetical protein MATL_G00018250 [Megalops atlanticus]|uniref:Uncharacterized protein n=1 Tax=Megalops atlanticus TaxID=7932 RepID=A0A9D3QH97_MEGAT|nr:hypothetical protein MATL_G00018250 [Megalops atlanticus]
MITSPSVSALRNSITNQVWESSGSGKNSSANVNKPFLHSVPPSDPLRQANRLPIKVLKMLTARAGHILHPEYLQPLPSTPVSPIELDAKKSPLALLAQTCSQIAVYSKDRQSEFLHFGISTPRRGQIGRQRGKERI